MTYMVCPKCEGHGTSTEYLGAFTADRLYELGPEFAEDYAAGNYDRPCPECNGRRVVTDQEHEDYLDERYDQQCRMMESGHYDA